MGVAGFVDMRILLAVAAMGVFPLFAQFENLSTTDDGSVIYFSTRLRPPGSRDSSWPKVYRLDGSGFQLAAQAREATGGSLETGGWMVERASVSGDGSVVAFQSRITCRFGSPCVGIPQEFSEIRTRLGSQRLLGFAEISRNGRYAAVLRLTGFGIFPTPEVESQRGLNRLDLQSGERVRIGAEPAQTGKWIGSDGTILIDGWQLVTPGGGAIPMGSRPAEVYRAELSADTALVVYQLKREPSALWIRDRTGADVLLAEVGTSPSISADSQRILYLAPVEGKLQAFVWHRGGAVRQLTTEPAGVAEATLSGTTGLAAMVTGAGELITVDVRNGYRAEYIGRSPKPPPYPLTPFSEPLPEYPGLGIGSTYSIEGELLASEAAVFEPALPLGGGGVRVFVNGTEAAIYSVAPERVTYQVSWDTRESESTADSEVVLQRGDRAFEMVLALRRVAKSVPFFIPLATEPNPTNPSTAPPLPVYAIHGDWRGLVRPADPAVEGELVHLYATGLGPVTPAVPTGAASPTLPPAALADSMRCGWMGDGDIQAEVLFAGLAPGLIGLYQVTVRVRDDLTIPVPTVVLSCLDGTANAWFAVRVTP